MDKQMPNSQETSVAPVSRRNLLLSLFAKAAVAALITLAGLLGAVLAIRTAHGFTFGSQAAFDAGESPSREVSLRLASLLMWQDYANAVLTGMVLAVLLLIASRCLDAISRGGLDGMWFRPLRSFLIAVTIGGGCLAAACLAFRMQQVGTQDLVSATLIHAILWAGLGAIVQQSMGRSSGAGWAVNLPVLAGGLWGAIFPVLIAMIDPGAYVERLFATDKVIGLWAGFGGVALLTAGVAEDIRVRKGRRFDEKCEVNS